MKKSLGRGLDALIPRGGAKDGRLSDGRGVLMELDLTDIIPNDNQPRTRFDEESLNELADSIKDKGVIQPIIVTRSSASDKYMIIEGERRWRASGIAGRKTVPAVFKTADTPKERLELALITNAQREDLNPMELARAYDKLLEEYGYRQEDLGVIMGKSRSAVANRLRLLSLPEGVQRALETGSITEGHARALLGLKDPSLITSLMKAIIAGSMSVRETENAVKRFNRAEDKENIEAEKASLPAYVKEIRGEIESFFHTKVNIKKKSRGGVIEISYGSDDELDAIIKKIRGEVC